MAIKLGTKVRDRQTGFTGIAVGRAEYLNNDPSIAIQQLIGKGGDMPKTVWIDEGRVVLVKKVSKKKQHVRM